MMQNLRLHGLCEPLQMLLEIQFQTLEKTTMPCLKQFQKCMSRYGLSQNDTIRTCTLGHGTGPHELDSFDILSRLRCWSEISSDGVSMHKCESRNLKVKT